MDATYNAPLTAAHPDREESQGAERNSGRHQNHTYQHNPQNPDQVIYGQIDVTPQFVDGIINMRRTIHVEKVKNAFYREENGHLMESQLELMEDYVSISQKHIRTSAKWDIPLIGEKDITPPGIYDNGFLDTLLKILIAICDFLFPVVA